MSIMQFGQRFYLIDPKVRDLGNIITSMVDYQLLGKKRCRNKEDTYKKYELKPVHPILQSE